MKSGSLGTVAAFAATLSIAILVGPALGWEQSASPEQVSPEVLDLYRGETIDFTALAPTSIISAVKCGPDGDIYAIYAGVSPSALAQFTQSGGLFRQPISRVSASSKSVTEYSIPALSGYSRVSRDNFDVAPDGTLYALLGTARRSGAKSPLEFGSLIAKYNDDGTVDSQMSVGEGPGRKRIQPLRVAVFKDGSFLLSGTTVPPQEELAKGAQLGTFAGVFSRSGTFVGPIKLMEVVAVADSRSGSRGKSPEGGAERSSTTELRKLDANAVSLESSTLSFDSPDGNVYVLQGTYAPHLYVVSPAGYIARQYRLQPPAPGLSPVQMAGAGAGYVFIVYAAIAAAVVPGGNLGQRDMITVLDSETGQVTAVYRIPMAEVGLSEPACAVSPGDFLFLGTSNDNHLEVVRYVAR